MWQLFERSIIYKLAKKKSSKGLNLPNLMFIMDLTTGLPLDLESMTDPNGSEYRECQITTFSVVKGVAVPSRIAQRYSLNATAANDFGTLTISVTGTR